MAPAELTLIYCVGGDHEADRRKGIFVGKRLRDGLIKISVRKMAGDYAIFVNDHFEKSLPVVPVLAKSLAVGTFLKGYEVDNIRLAYWSDQANEAFLRD